jgi:hypothetical protein
MNVLIGFAIQPHTTVGTSRGIFYCQREKVRRFIRVARKYSCPSFIGNIFRRGAKGVS